MAYDWLQSPNMILYRTNHITEQAVLGCARLITGRRPIRNLHYQKGIPLGGATVTKKTSRPNVCRMLRSRERFMGVVVYLIDSYRFC